MMNQIFSIALLRATLRMATPLILSGLGGAMTLHAGTINIALEGMMLAGAFFAIVGSYMFSSWLAGVLFGVLAAVLIGLLYALLVVDLKADTFVIGIALNMFVLGGTIYLLRKMFGVKGAFSSPKIQTLPVLSLKFLNDSNVLSQLFGGYTLLVYIAFVCVIICSVLFYKTAFGLRLRAGGEHFAALDSVGVGSRKFKYLAYIGSGILCGLAGAHLSLGYLNSFTENMVAGNGFIALAATIFGRGNPVRILSACLLFGSANAVAIRLQSVGLPSEFTLMIPYVMTILALWSVSVQQMKRESIA